jgi:hypothetical protein
MIRALTAILLAIFAAPALARDPSVGTGWSRAPDLSVYGALVLSAEIAQEREMLCRGRNPAAVEDAWRAAYGARAAWIADAMTRRYGAAAVARAGQVKVGRLTCPTFADQSWRRHHESMLRLLELRLVPRDHFRRPAP